MIFPAISLLHADAKQDLWLKAAAEKNLELRLQLFEEFKDKYGEKETKNTKYLYLNLTQASFQLKKFEKSIEYGEKALSFEDIEGNHKIQLYLWLANAYNITQKDMEKAYYYAGLVVDFGKTLKQRSENTKHSKKLNEQLDKGFIAPALRIQIRILYSKGKNNPQIISDATKKAVEAFKLDNSKKSADLVYRLSLNLSKMNRIDDAIQYVEQITNENSPNSSGLNLLGTWYYKKGNRVRAVEYFQKSYEAMKKNRTAAKMALKIGQLISKMDKEKAMMFFAESYILSDSDQESNAYKYLRQLWFNELAKGKPQEEQDQGFTEILNAAKSRLGIEDF
jgi:tetratricopeptide (TPR) repeat protein